MIQHRCVTHLYIFSFIQQDSNPFKSVMIRVIRVSIPANIISLNQKKIFCFFNPGRANSPAGGGRKKIITGCNMDEKALSLYYKH